MSTGGYTAIYSYTYDANGNIISETIDGKTTTYVYDSANQLIRENNQAANRTWEWTYDSAGNIRSEKEYLYTTGTPGSVLSSKNYNYDQGDGKWGDLLVNYNGKPISYDSIGNILSDTTWNYTWKEGRKLATMSNGTYTWTYTYDANGMRIKRSSGSTTYNYTYHGSQLTHMTYGNIEMHFYYDASGRPLSVVYNGSTYYYVLNLQGDVVAILDSNGVKVVGYIYDAWGRLIDTTDSMKSTLGLHNPLRYRGYVYDRETGLYYLESRYYNPEIGRFINEDRYVSTGTGVLGFNMFAYCNNSPVNFVDFGGDILESFLDDVDDNNGFLNEVLGGGGGFGAGTYHYGVDLSVAARSSSFGNGLLSCGYSSYSYTTPAYGTGGTGSNRYIPRGADGNLIPLRKQRVNGQDIPLPDPNASGPHTVLGGKISSTTGEVYRQSATFPGATWPTANGQNVPWSEVHWTDHNTPHHHTNPHQHIFEYDPNKGGWIRTGPTPYYR